MNRLQSLAEEIIRRHAEWTIRWHAASIPSESAAPWNFIEQNHRMNFDLWHAEDDARRDDLGPEHVSNAKRTIDRCNQVRNDAIEQLDVWLLRELPPLNGQSPLRSETPGMIIDRLSIMSLKLYHMRIEAARESAGAEHRHKCAERGTILEEQLGDLRNCLKEFLTELEMGQCHFKLYRQFKMYNDPSLNPQLYHRPEPLPED